jgi:hypothetical protein
MFKKNKLSLLLTPSLGLSVVGVEPEKHDSIFSISTGPYKVKILQAMGPNDLTLPLPKMRIPGRVDNSTRALL